MPQTFANFLKEWDIGEIRSKICECQAKASPKCRGKFIQTRGKEQTYCIHCLNWLNILPSAPVITPKIETSETDRTTTLYKTIEAGEVSKGSEGNGGRKIRGYFQGSPKKHEEMIGLLKKGKSASRISQLYECDHTTILYWASKLGLRHQLSRHKDGL